MTPLGAWGIQAHRGKFEVKDDDVNRETISKDNMRRETDSFDEVCQGNLFRINLNAKT